jgi:hypothetical protein
MNRRTLFSRLSIAAFAIVGSPYLAFSRPSRHTKLNLNASSNNLLEALTDFIIPETDTPGSKTLEIPLFVSTMIADVYSKKDQEKFKNSLEKLDNIARLTYGNPFESLNLDQKKHLFESLKLSSDQDLNWFAKTLKNLSVQAYTSSEYFQTNIAKFEFAPARYYGCIDRKNA